MEKNCSSNQKLPFEVVERKPNVFTRISEMMFAKKQRVKVRFDVSPEMKAYKERKQVSLNASRPLSKNEDTLQFKVRTHLLDGKSITVLECMDLFHSTELRHVISNLRKHMEIHDELVTTPSNKKIKRYYC